MQETFDEFKRRLAEIEDLSAAAAVLAWDMETYMPPGGAAARGRQLATLARLSHEKFTDPAIGRMLDELRSYEEGLSPDSDDASLIRVTRRDYEQATRVPSEFVALLSAHTAEGYNLWTAARPANDWSMVHDHFERTIDLSRRYADFFPGYEHIADPLIDFADYGMKASVVREVFAQLREQLVPLMRTITEQPVADDTCLRQHFPERQQLAFGEKVIRQLGYDFERGRQDKTHHPFMTKFSIGDVRITTRFKEDDLNEGLFSTIHESGHAMYEQGIRKDFEGSPLAGGTSAGVHESQSRLWENIVGRGRSFWQYWYPQLQQAFPDQLGSVSLDTFYRAINKVARSLIRTDADEVTYNLHVMLRFDLELELLEGKLEARDLPEAWRERYKADLGITPPDDRDGVLQDVHWFGGTVGGAFQGYTLGNILSAQFYDAATRAHPRIEQEIASGQFGTLHTWLTEHLYQHGRKYTAPELIQRATGGPLSIEPYVRYLKAKFGELYTL
jgi:carboxypeptidase Taq